MSISSSIATTDPSSLASQIGTNPIAWVCLALVIGVAVWLAASATERARVRASSSALAELSILNEDARDGVKSRPAIRAAYRDRVTSKRRLEKLDLQRFLTVAVFDDAARIDPQIEGHLAAAARYESYSNAYSSVVRDHLGRSEHPRIRPQRYVRVERILAARAKLKAPRSRASVYATVSYTSPKGQNSYSRRLSWGFNELKAAVEVEREARSRASHAAALHRRERALMTNGLRMEILRRDENRCRICGASASDGVKLHVDHITPVSLGGVTERDNLQVLCEPCNLGKSNHFVG